MSASPSLMCGACMHGRMVRLVTMGAAMLFAEGLREASHWIS